MAPAGYGNRVEGLHSVEAAAASGRVRKLWVEEKRLGRAEIADIVQAVGREKTAPVRDVRPMAETEAPQGLVADCDPIMPISIHELGVPKAAVVVLDHVEDPHNVGAIARSALAAGMTGMVVSSRRAAPLSATAFKAAAGALETLPVSIVGSVPEGLSRLKDRGVWIVGLEAGSTRSLFGLDLLTEPVAVVVGAEGAGLSVLSAKRCDVLASIPMAAGFESLNASVSAALACFEIMRVRAEADPSLQSDLAPG
ncbi:MAG: RNA methyltransferase [Acidimicrobiia bacterium]|jgi:23S rRNA (guanosine2251-2'-O)-methyltransferase